MTKVDPAIDVKEMDYSPRNKDDEYNYRLCRSPLPPDHSNWIVTNHPLDEPELYRDAPISLQLVGRRYEDEKIIKALEFIKQNVPPSFDA